MNKKPVVFLDRDGVIVQNVSGFNKYATNTYFEKEALGALAELAKEDVYIFIVTNQAAVGRGLMTKSEQARLSLEISWTIWSHGGRIDETFVCTHTPESFCDCRKPETGLFREALERYPDAGDPMFMVGDFWTDTNAAIRMGATPILVKTGRGQQALDSGKVTDDVIVCSDLMDAVKTIKICLTKQNSVVNRLIRAVSAV